MSTSAEARRWMDRAGRAALRGRGLVEPNPAVGCVLVSERGEVVTARHRGFGAPHAEAAALTRARELGIDARGAIVYVTLEPCVHRGKTPPCVDALIDAGVGEVVVARADPSAQAGGGARALRAAGIEVRFDKSSALALRAGAPFVKGVETGLPWVTVKWAQTIDGALAGAGGDSRWISGEGSRRDVHRWRGRVDAVVTGIGTVLADDPLLTARAAHPRRLAIRVVMDGALETPLGCALTRSAVDVPVVVLTTADALADRAEHASALRRAGVQIASFASSAGGTIDLRAAMQWLYNDLRVSTVLLEAGGTLAGAAIEAGVADEVLVYLAPLMLGDAAARRPLFENPAMLIAEGTKLRLAHTKRFGNDVRLVYAVGDGG